MKALVDKKRGRAFPPCYAFDNDIAHITAINQSVMQDTLWVHREAELIHDISTPGHTGPALWTGKIIGSNNSAPEPRTHPIQDHELIVRVRAASVPRILIRHYPNRRTADKALAQGTQN
ncbi:hypothetical protein BFJ71_g12466 [Fusarium oxysporum]|nr:hypothetical protein BFJ71_g12466 [Fusarium oxysporum]